MQPVRHGQHRGGAEQIGCTTKELLTGSLKEVFERDIEVVGAGAKKVPDNKVAQKAEKVCDRGHILNANQ